MSNNDCGISINDNHTDIAVKVYKNRLFIIVTQFQKFGSMVTVTRESSLDQFNSDTYSTHVIFGKDTEEIHAAVRYIAEAINIDRPLLISIALKDYELSTLRVIVSIINKLKAW